MSNDDEGQYDVDDGERIGRLQGIRQHLQRLEQKNFTFLELPNIYDVDPVASSPYIIPGSFISEEVGGSVTIIDDESEESLAQENVNQMLNNFLPGGYKQRWGNFDLWRGAWGHESQQGHADIGPMFEWAESFPLTDLLGDVSEVAYTDLNFDPENVTVYVPRTVRVEKLDRHRVRYVWLPEKGIVWTGRPPMTYEDLSSDPTTNYLWFKHARDDFAAEPEPISDSKAITGYAFDDEREFVRCYYASLLTMYPKGSTQTQSGLIRYRSEADDKTAFVGSRERSQLLRFELARDELQDRIADALANDSTLKRDLQFAYLHTLIWRRLFFQDEALAHEYAVEPLVEHLVGVDYWMRVVEDEPMGVFGLSGQALVAAVEELLPERTGRLRLLGHSAADSSSIATVVREHTDALARLLAMCRNESLLREFAERVVVHSAEHGVSTWANELTGAGTSFELWYDVNFQESESETARIAVYDPIEGGAGIAKEVYETLRSATETGIDTGLADQGCCHSATADRATVELLGAHPNGALYDLYENDTEEFLSLVDDTIETLVGASIEDLDDDSAYNPEDLRSHVEHRTRALFETRSLATFYSYVAAEHMRVEEQLGRTPRPADLVLHLDRHVFRDPEIRTTYEQFSDNSGRRDLTELGERIEELTIQCITACPDCLKTDAGLCVHGSSHQGTMLNRRLLSTVFQK